MNTKQEVGQLEIKLSFLMDSMKKAQAISKRCSEEPTEGLKDLVITLTQELSSIRARLTHLQGIL